MLADAPVRRLASTKQKGSGMWFHHGMKGADIFKEVEKEIDQMWNQMLQDIVGKVQIKEQPGTPGT